MQKEELVSQIRKKRSFLCVGLDTDPDKIPAPFSRLPDPVFEFNREIINATRDFAVAYKINTAFYEAQGMKGWRSLERTLQELPADTFKIADAKRGDIANTGRQYARAFFETFPFDAITVSPYMGEDSVTPFMEFSGKWAILLLLTSNKGATDFQQQKVGNERLFELILKRSQQWDGHQRLMYVMGATHPSELATIRKLAPDAFFLIPGVGAQGGSLSAVAEAALTSECGLLVNASRAILYAGTGEDFAAKAQDKAREYQQEMESLLQKYRV
ncbi:MAG: orotidine-5'-phosphate decarboxylase [Bacteroidia bacterium]